MFKIDVFYFFCFNSTHFTGFKMNTSDLHNASSSITILPNMRINYTCKYVQTIKRFTE